MSPLKIYRNKMFMRRFFGNKLRVVYRIDLRVARNSHYYLKARRQMRDGEFYEPKWMRG